MTVVLPPYSRASFLDDMFADLLSYLVLANSGAIGDLAYDPQITDHDGTRNVLNGRTTPFVGYSDHVFFNSGNIGIPAVNLFDFPAAHHHSQNDKLEFLDPTQLKRYVCLAAAAAYSMGWTDSADSLKIMDLVYHSARGRLDKERRLAESLLRNSTKDNIVAKYRRASNLLVQSVDREGQALGSTRIFAEADAPAISHLDYLLKVLKTQKEDMLRETAELYVSKCAELNMKAIEVGLTAEELALQKIIPRPHPELRGSFGHLNEYPAEKYQLKDIMPDEPCYFELFNLMDGHRNMLDIVRFVEAEALSAGYDMPSSADILDFLKCLKEADVLVGY
jgi:hypothetical protein